MSETELSEPKVEKWSLRNIEDSSIFAVLSDKRKEFIVAYINNGLDKVKTGHQLWNCQDDDVARVLVNRMLSKPRIAYLLGKYTGQDVLMLAPVTKREMKALIGQRMRAPGLDNDMFLKLATQLVRLTLPEKKPDAINGSGRGEGGRFGSGTVVVPNEAELVDDLVRKIEKGEKI